MSAFKSTRLTARIPYANETNAWKFVNYMYFLSISPRYQPLELSSASVTTDTLRQRISGARYHIVHPDESSPFIPLSLAAAQTRVSMGPQGKVIISAYEAFAVEIRNIDVNLCPYWGLLKRADTFLISPINTLTETYPAMSNEAIAGFRLFIKQRPALAATMVGSTYTTFRK